MQTWMWIALAVSIAAAGLLTIGLCRASGRLAPRLDHLPYVPDPPAPVATARTRRVPSRTYDRACCEFCHKVVAIRADGEPFAKRHKCVIPGDPDAHLTITREQATAIAGVSLRDVDGDVA